MEALRPRVVDLVDAYLDRLASGDEVDVIAELRLPLPVFVIGELLGVPPEDRERFRSLVRAMKSLGERRASQGGVSAQQLRGGFSLASVGVSKRVNKAVVALQLAIPSVSKNASMDATTQWAAGDSNPAPAD